MSIKSNVKSVTKVNWATAGSVVAGMVLFGGLMWAVSRLPTNAVTSPIKQAADAVKV